MSGRSPSVRPAPPCIDPGRRSWLLSREDDAFLLAVASDLAFLEDDWQPSIEDQSLRRSSNVLRTLLVQHAIGQAWRRMGQSKEPKIEAPDLANALAGLKIEKVEFAQAAGARTAGDRAARSK